MTHTPTRTLRRSVSTGACAALLAGGALAVTPAPSYADSVSVSDPSGDPVQDPDNGSYQPAPEAQDVDLLRTRFDYRGRVLVVRGTARRASANVQQLVRVRSGGKDTFFFTVGRDVVGDRECPGASARIDKQKATYTVRIPARCIGTPDAVRVGFALMRSSRALFTIDDAQRAGVAEDSRGPRLGRALERG